MAQLIKSDLEFILQQILIAEAHAAGADPASLLPNSFVPFGLRTVDGSFNNLVPGQSEFGAADNLFPRLVDPVFRDDADGDTFWPRLPTQTMAPPVTWPMRIRASSATSSSTRRSATPRPKHSSRQALESWSARFCIT